MWEDCQVQKKKNSRSYQRTLTYLYLQKIKCHKCNRILGGKATTKKNGKPYFYYYCNDCKITIKENAINEYFNQFINELAEYDSVVNQFFLPMIRQRFDEPKEKLQTEIDEQSAKLERIRKAYINGTFDLDIYTSETDIVKKTINKIKEELEATDCSEELRFTPKDILLKIENCTRGMKKQVGKSKLFTKTTLTEIQDKMRSACIKSYNKFYEVNTRLKEKQKGRNQDINVKDMGDYRQIKKQLKQKEQKLEKANNQTKILDNSSNDIKEILNNLKSTKLNKNNMVISNEDVQKIKNYTEDVKDIIQTVRNVNDLNMAIKDFEHSNFEIEKENHSLKYEIELKDNEISNLKKELSTKEKIIGKLQTEKEKLKQELQKLKGFWYSIMSHFHKRICYDKDNNYKIVSDGLYKNGIFDDNDNEIANNIYRKVTIPDENKQTKYKKKNNDTRF